MWQLSCVLAMAMCAWPTVVSAQGRVPAPAASPASATDRPSAPDPHEAATSTRSAAETSDPSTAVPQGPSPTALPTATTWTRWSRATGDWNGLRRTLETRGVDVGLTVTADLSRTRSSRVAAASVGRALIDTSTTLDLETLWGFTGTTLFVQHLARVGASGAERAGDHQGFSNIDAPPFARAGEIWIEQSIVSDRLRVKAGRLDANDEFAAVDAAGAFLNSSMGYSPTILLLPTYPDPRLGAVVAADPLPVLSVKAGVYDGTTPDCDVFETPDEDLFVIAEVATAWTLGASGRPGRAAVGVWRHTGTLRRLDGEGTMRGTQSPFVTLEQTLWQAGDHDAAPRARAFAQYGSASGLASEIERHVGGGVVFEGFQASRPSDAFGLAVTSIRLSSRAVDAEENGTETALAAFYRHRLTPWLAVQPDLQYVVHAEGRVPRHSALLLTVRLQVVF